jgi:hypothetical protein
MEYLIAFEISSLSNSETSTGNIVSGVGILRISSPTLLKMPKIIFFNIRYSSNTIAPSGIVVENSGFAP